MSAILGGQVSVGINGLAEFAPQIEAGTVRVLGISSAERLPGVDAPTLREQGVDVEFENWRSLVAPPGISPADRRASREAPSTAMVRSAEWREALERYRWIDRYLAGDEFARFVDSRRSARARHPDASSGLAIGRNDRDAAAGVYPLLVLAGLRALRLRSGARDGASPHGVGTASAIASRVRAWRRPR